jgi:serine/threonine protein kinase
MVADSPASKPTPSSRNQADKTGRALRTSSRLKTNSTITPEIRDQEQSARSSGRPSLRWTGLSNIDPNSAKYTKIQAFLSKANFRQLEILAIRARRKQPKSPPDVTCSIDQDRFASGFNNIVMEVAFSDSCYWIVRIPYRKTNANRSSESFLSEVTTMQIVRDNTSIPVPQIYGFDASTSRGFGYPYIFMEYLGGHALGGILAKTVPQTRHHKVAQQLAKVYFELSRLTYDRIGRLLPGETTDQPTLIPMAGYEDTIASSLDYFYTERIIENREALDQHPHDAEWAAACGILKMAIPSFIIDQKVHGQFPLSHIDIHHGNLLFDDEYNLVGVIDWSSAQTVPLERLCLCPELITFPGLTEEENRPILELRRLFVDSLRALESAETNPKDESLSSFVSSPSYEIAFRSVYSTSNRTLWMGRLVAKLMFGNIISWEQFVELNSSKRTVTD